MIRLPQPFEPRNILQQNDLFHPPVKAHKGWTSDQPERGGRPRADERRHLSHSRLDALDQLGKMAMRGAMYADEEEHNIPNIGQGGSSRKQQKHFPPDNHLKAGGLIDSQKWPEKQIAKRDDFLNDHFKGMVIGSRARELQEGRGMKKVIEEGKSNAGRALEGIPLPARVPRDAQPSEDSRQLLDALLGKPLPEDPHGRRDILSKEDSTQVVDALLGVPLTPNGHPRRDFLPEEDSIQVIKSLYGVPLPIDPNRRGMLLHENSKQMGAVVSGWEHTDGKKLHSASEGKVPGWANSKQVVDSLLGVPLPQQESLKKQIHDAQSHQVNAALQAGLYPRNSPRFYPRKPLPAEDSSQVAERLRLDDPPVKLGPLGHLSRVQLNDLPPKLRPSGPVRQDRDGAKLRGSCSEPTIGVASLRSSAFAARKSGNMAPCASHAQGAVPSRNMSDSLQASATAAVSFNRGHKFGYGGFLWNHHGRLKSSEFAMLQNSHTDPGKLTYKICDTRHLCTT